jgi:UDP-glucose 4-epimerase
VIDNFYSGSPNNLSHLVRTGRVSLVRADISDYRKVMEALSGKFSSGDVEGIVHLAAIINVVEALRFPRRAVQVNVMGTVNMLEAARKLDVDRFVFASSVAVYGEPKRLPIDESHQTQPVNLYGLTKLMGEKLLWRWYEDYGIKGIALRYFNVYGPRMRPGPYAGVVYNFIRALAAGVKPAIYGDGLQTRDFIYVEDVAHANLLALKSKYVGAVNICSGRETSIVELYSLICSIVMSCPGPEYGPPRPGDVRRSVGDPSLAEKVLGWRPLTDLREGLAKTLAYYLNRPN